MKLYTHHKDVMDLVMKRLPPIYTSEQWEVAYQTTYAILQIETIDWKIENLSVSLQQGE